MANSNHFELNNHRLRDDRFRLSDDPRELRSSAISHGREKLDNVKPFCYGDSEELHKPREHESFPQSETVFDLRKSLAWDSAFFTSPGVLDTEELLGTVEVGVLDNPASVCGPREHVYLPSDEPEIASRIGKCNLRRSLAWDSAFLTDAGVLDPDELCIINKGLNKSEPRGLPGVERLHRSVDSGCFSLESLEYELFEVARKSRQKGNTSNVTSSRFRKGIASKKTNASSRGRIMSPMLASSKQSVDMHGPVTTTKEASGHPRGLMGRSVELNPSALKPPKIVKRVNSVPVAPSKRVTSGAKHGQVEDNSTKDASGQHMAVSKKQCLRNPLSVISISAPVLPKSPRLGSSTPKKESVDCGVTPAPDATAKSPLSSLRRNPHCRSVVNGSRYPPRNKPDSSNSSQHSCLLPLHKSSSSASLASSVDVWSSESSPPTLKSQKISIRQKNLSTSYSSLGFSSDSNPTQTSDMGGLPQLKTTPELRPSGLRKPSPKLGYFYGMTSSLSPTGVLQYQWDTKDTPLRDATRSCDLDRDADSAKHTKLPTARTSMRTWRTKTGVLSPLSESQLKTQKVANAEHGVKVKTRGTERQKVQRKGHVCGGTRKQHLKRQAESNLQKPNLREKENLFSFEDHVNSLSNHIGAFDLGVM